MPDFTYVGCRKENKNYFCVGVVTTFSTQGINWAKLPTLVVVR